MSVAPSLSHALAVAVGAACGALLRWQAGVWLNTAGAALPLGTLLVNIAGGLLIGAAMAWFGRHPDEWLRLLLVTGFLGGLTTFSAFSAESLLMLQRQDWGTALAHALSHVLGALGAAALGHRLASALLS